MKDQSTASRVLSEAEAADKARTRKTPYDPRAEIVRAVNMPLVTGMSYPTIWRWTRAGKFPKPIRLGPQSIGWRRSDIDAWLQARQS